MMALTKKKDSSYSWWFDSHNSSPRQSSWLQTTLKELDEKTRAMLKVIEEDADSFAQRAEMYYRKRPELVSMVEEFYRAHRSLAEKYDQLRGEVGSRCQAIQMGSPLMGKCPPRSSKSVLSDRSSVASTDSFESEASELVDDLEPAESQVGAEDVEVTSKASGVQVVEVEEEEVACFREPNIVQVRDGAEKMVAVRPLCVSARERELSDEVDKLQEEVKKLKEQTATIKPKMKHDGAEERLSDEDSEVLRLQQELNQAREELEEQKEIAGKDEVKELKEQTATIKPKMKHDGAEERPSDEDSEVLRLQQELNQAREELEEQKKEIAGKDEEKREAIRQLCLSLEMLKEENTCLKTYWKDDANKKSSALNFIKVRGVFSRMFQTSTLVAL